MNNDHKNAERKFVEIHSAVDIADEMGAIMRSPEMWWWLGLVHGEWALRNGDRCAEIFRCEAYNRLSERLFK